MQAEDFEIHAENSTNGIGMCVISSFQYIILKSENDWTGFMITEIFVAKMSVQGSPGCEVPLISVTIM